MKNDYVPFQDPQQKKPAFLCPVCGREVYGAGGQCLYCAVYGA